MTDRVVSWLGRTGKVQVEWARGAVRTANLTASTATEHQCRSALRTPCKLLVLSCSCPSSQVYTTSRFEEWGLSSGDPLLAYLPGSLSNRSNERPSHDWPCCTGAVALAARNGARREAWIEGGEATRQPVVSGGASVTWTDFRRTSASTTWPRSLRPTAPASSTLSRPTSS